MIRKCYNKSYKKMYVSSHWDIHFFYDFLRVKKKKENMPKKCMILAKKNVYYV